MYFRKLVSLISVFVVLFAVSVAATAQPASKTEQKSAQRARVAVPLNLAILIQDDLVPQVDNELDVTRDFIRSLPEGSRVMVGYITTGTLQVRQPFTSDLNKAASSLRILRSSSSAAAYNPYVEVIEGLRAFDNVNGRKALLLISDGLDTSHGFDVTSAANTIDLKRAISHANEREVAVFTFYAPSVTLTNRSRLAASYGQSSLNRLANETGGKAFFQGTSGFVSFDSYFRRLRESLNDVYARAR
jgi:VWFA-related protein